MEAKYKAFEKGIKANAIILNQNYDYLEEFYYTIDKCLYKTKRMILGCKLVLGRLPTKHEFAMVEIETPDYEELIRKYVRVINGQLVFKNISSKKNIKDFEAFHEEFNALSKKVEELTAIPATVKAKTKAKEDAE